MKLGARILKTGIAIVLSLFISQLLNLPSPIFAGIAAIFAVQPTIYRSYLSIIEQIQGNVIGALIAVVFVLLLGNNVLIIGLAAIIVITITLKLKLENAIGLSLVTLIAIMETPGETFIEFAFIRFSTIMLGVLSAFLVNLLFLRPKYENRLYQQITMMTTDITKWIRLNIRGASEHKLLKKDIEAFKEAFMKIEQTYLMYKEERNFLKKDNLEKIRKQVIYRQMISTLKRSLEVLKKLHRFENEIVDLPDEFQNMFVQQLDCIIHHHEHIMLKFIGKVKPNVQFDEGDMRLSREELIEQFIILYSQIQDEKDSTHYHIMQVIAAINDYDEYVEHLDLLITSFQSYHKGESDVTLPDYL
nr:aromatic acid exporter family protein [uncultured Bacillus sp.]